MGVLTRCLGPAGGGVGRQTQAAEASREHERRCQDQGPITVKEGLGPGESQYSRK